MDKSFIHLGSTVIILSVVAYTEFPAWIMLIWVVMAPLEDTQFNRCKSALKLLETGVWGVPLIATLIENTQLCSAKVCFTRKENEWLERF